MQDVALGTEIRTTRQIGSMAAGTVGQVVRRNKHSVTITPVLEGFVQKGLVATVPRDAFEAVSAETPAFCPTCGESTNPADQWACRYYK